MKVLEALQTSIQTINTDRAQQAYQRPSSRRKPGPWASGSKSLAEQIIQALTANIKSELQELRQIPRRERTPEQQNRIKELKAQLQALR